MQGKNVISWPRKDGDVPMRGTENPVAGPRAQLDVNSYVLRRSPYYIGTQRAGCKVYDHINNMFVPVDYGHDRQVAYNAVREHVALYDAAIQRQIQLTGEHALEFADYLFTRDLSSLEVHQARYGFLCRPDGVILTDAVVTRVDPETIWISPTDSDVLLWAEGLRTCTDLDVEVCEAAFASAHLHGPQSRTLLRMLIGDSIDELRFFRCMNADIANTDVIVSRTCASPVLGYEVLVPDSGAMDVWNAIVDVGRELELLVTGFDDPAEAIEGGMLFFSHVTTTRDRFTPLEFWRDFVDLEGDDFIGKDALTTVQTQGGPTRKLVGLIGSGTNLPSLVDRWEVYDGERSVGFTRWIAPSLTVGKNIGYALVDRKYADCISHELTVVHPEGKETMTITDVPFVSLKSR